MKKVVMITGSYPPDICGVGDYTFNLMQTKIGQSWDLYYSKNWGLTSIFGHIKRLNKFNASEILMQYPTSGYGWSIVPHLLCLYYCIFTSIKFTVVIHENSQQSVKYKIALTSILLLANKIIFTNEFERKYACNFYKGLNKKSFVVKIFSNIPSDNYIKKIDDREIDLINFGHIRPDKGVEDFINTVCQLRKQNAELKSMIIGQIPNGLDLYYKQIESLCLENKIQIKLNLSSIEVAQYLNNSKIAYLPFPDGISERRGSFLASLKNGTVVASLNGNFVTESIKESIILIEDTRNAGEILNKYLNKIELLYPLQEKAYYYLEKELPISWDAVVETLNKIMLK